MTLGIRLRSCGGGDAVSDQKLWPLYLSEERVSLRRSSYGLLCDELESFTSASEFVSLGNFCGIAYCLMALNVKRWSFPFDWVRVPLDGVTDCFETNFADFLTVGDAVDWSYAGDDPNQDEPNTKFSNTRWGGSFYHHDIRDVKVVEGFQRRIDRLMGLTADVPINRRRIFVRVANTTREVADLARLVSVLRVAFRNCDVRLLLLLELQGQEELVQVPELGSDVFVGRVHYGGFDAGCMELVMEQYARVLAQALRCWAHVPQETQPRVVGSLSELSTLCEQYDGGNCATDFYLPKLLGSPQQLAIMIPEGLSAGDKLQTVAFGKTLRITLPHGVSAGQWIQLRHVDGAVEAIFRDKDALGSAVKASAAMVAGTATI